MSCSSINNNVDASKRTIIKGFFCTSFNYKRLHLTTSLQIIVKGGGRGGGRKIYELQIKDGIFRVTFDFEDLL